MKEPIRVAVRSGPRIVRIPALSGNLSWNIHLPLSPPSNVVRPTGIKPRMLKTYGRSSGFIALQGFRSRSFSLFAGSFSGSTFHLIYSFVSRTSRSFGNCS
jgi:hypothetical protein